MVDNLFLSFPEALCPNSLVSFLQSLKKPVIPKEFGGKVPTVVRQRYLNLFIEECLKFCSSNQEAIEKVGPGVHISCTGQNWGHGCRGLGVQLGRSPLVSLALF